MRFTIAREKLQDGLLAVAASVPAKTTLPVLANILVETTDRGIRLSATDLDMAVSTELDRRRGCAGCDHHPGEEVERDRARIASRPGEVLDDR